MDSLDAMSMDEMKAMIISMREENNKLKSEVPPPAVPFSSPSSSSSSASLSEAEILLGKLSLEQINRKIAIQKIISSIHLDANQRGLKLSNPRNAAELMNYKTSIIEYLNGKKLLFTILDKYNGRDLLNDINNIYLLVKDEAKIIVYNFLKSTMADRIRSQYGSDSNKCDPKVLWHRLMTADVEEVNLPGVKKAKTTLLDAVELQFNENSVTAAQHIERIEKAFAEYGHLVQYYRECGKNAVPIDNDDLSEGDKIVVLLNSIMKAAKHEKAYQQLHRDLLKVRTYEAACDEFKNAVASRQALLSQLSNRGNDLLFAEDVESSTNDSIGVVNAIRSRQCINCGKEGHRSGYQPEGKKGEWIHSCPSRIIQCPRCNRWGHQEQFCRTPRVKFVSKDRYPDPNLSRTIRAEKNDAEDDNADEKKNNAGKEEVSGGRLRNKLIGKSALCVDKLLLHYNDRK